MFHKEESLAAIQQQKLYNKSGNHGVPDANLFNVTFLLVDFGQGLIVFICKRAPAKFKCSYREDFIPQVLTGLIQIHRVYFVLSFVHDS